MECNNIFQSVIKIDIARNQSAIYFFLICLLLIISSDREVTTILGSSFQNSHLHNSSPSDKYRMSCVPFH